MELQSSIIINSPIENVWRAMIDPELKWSPIPTRVEFIDNNSYYVGSKFHVFMKTASTEFKSYGEVTEFDPPKKIGKRTTRIYPPSDFIYDEVYTFIYLSINETRLEYFGKIIKLQDAKPLLERWPFILIMQYVATFGAKYLMNKIKRYCENSTLKLCKIPANPYSSQPLRD